jgi:hypothetical protein
MTEGYELKFLDGPAISQVIKMVVPPTKDRWFLQRGGSEWWMIFDPFESIAGNCRKSPDGAHSFVEHGRDIVRCTACGAAPDGDLQVAHYRIVGSAARQDDGFLFTYGLVV